MKRTKAQKEEHLNALSKMYVKGMTQMDMARTLGLSQGQISNDLRMLLKRWEEERVHDIDRVKNEQLVRITIMESELWEAWELSKTAKKVRVHKTKTGITVDEIDPSTGMPVKAQKDKYWSVGSSEEEPTNGDMQYMNGIMWCLQERAKLLGLYAPKKIAQTDPTGEKEAGQGAREILDSIIGDILKRSAPEDKNVVEGELLKTFDADNSKEVEDEDVPELAAKLRQVRTKSLPPARTE